MQLQPGPSLNLITGDNGAGKTSVLEALHLMAYGRSFRGRVRDGLVQTGQAALEVFVEWQEHAWQGAAVNDAAAEISASALRTRKAGLRHTGQSWSGRLDGSDVVYLGELCAALAVVTFEPGSHALITGPAEIRRRYLDWGLFHVEQDFLALWRRYSRALKQRNAVLKARGGQSQLDAWDHELAASGEPLGQYRQTYLDALQPGFQGYAADMAPALGETRLEYQPGWRRDEWPLLDALLVARDRDLQAGFTSVGPHRADWRIHWGGVPGREALSRGQAKLTALSALFAQADHYAGARGEWPVVALDDLGSELDRKHQRRVIGRLVATGAQVFITGTELPVALEGMGVEFERFHVEHETISASPT